MRNVLVLWLIACAVGGIASAEPQPRIWVEVVVFAEPPLVSHGEISPGTESAPIVGFVDLPLVARVRVGSKQGSITKSADPQVQQRWLGYRPARGDWPASTRWEVRRSLPDGTTRLVSPSDLTVRHITMAEAVRPRSLAAARTDPSDWMCEAYELSNLPAGQYQIRVLVDLLPPGGGRAIVAAGEARPLAVYRGDESDVVRRAHLRVLTEQALSSNEPSSFENYRALMLELARISPDDPGVLERLADASLSRLPPDETLSYYQSALKIAERNLERQFGSAVPPKIAEGLTARRQKIEDFEKRVPYYRQHFDEVGLTILRLPGGERFIWYKRPNGPVLRDDQLPR